MKKAFTSATRWDIASLFISMRMRSGPASLYRRLACTSAMMRCGSIGGEGTNWITIPAGEEHKTLAVAETVWRELAAQGMGRDDHLVALGGGVVGDLAGFCAATYQRGVPVVQVPTTVVAQVDSAYGGKTGVDLPEGKNYVGAYHQPAAVLADPATLATLPAEELAAGWMSLSGIINTHTIAAPVGRSQA